VRRARRLAGPLLGALILAVLGVAVWPRLEPSTRGVPAPAATARTATAGAPLKLPDPRHRMLLGAFTALSGQTSGEASIERREAAMGRRYDLQATFYDWNDPFPDFGEATIAAHGRTPLMAWYGPGKDPKDSRTLAEINDGRDDAWIMRQAEAIKAFGRPIYLRPMLEMNGSWYTGYSGKPVPFIAAWRRIHGLFARAGARNVIWVWCPNVTPDDWDRYYPGDAYVDVIGVDAFDNVTAAPWQSFEQGFGPFFAHYAGRKPLMVAETATDAGESGAAAFISGMHSYLKNVAGPRYGVIALCWFDTDTDDAHNWRVDQTPGAWQAWLALARDPYFGGGRPRPG
jgi:Glycosyl hydrolase family 26